LDSTARTLDHYRHRLGAFCVSSPRSIFTPATPLPYSHSAVLYPSSKKELSSHTIHTCARAICAFLTFCGKEELLDKSPMAKVGLPQCDKLQPNYLTVVEVLELLDACQTERERAVVLVLLARDLRATELVNLNGSEAVEGS